LPGVTSMPTGHDSAAPDREHIARVSVPRSLTPLKALFSVSTTLLIGADVERAAGGDCAGQCVAI